MADTDDDQEPKTPRRRSTKEASRRMSAATAAKAGRQYMAELLGKKVEGTTSVEPADDGWLVGVEVVESERIPSTADILGLYEVEIDMEGDLVAYRRLRRYGRGRSDSSEAG